MKNLDIQFQKSRKTRIIFAILVGIISKLLTIPLFLLVYFLDRNLSFFSLVKLDTFASIFSTTNIKFSLFFSVLLLAPVIENLILPLIFGLTKFLKLHSAFAITIIIYLAFIYHSAGSESYTGAMFFACYSIFYSYSIKYCSKKEAYLLSVLSHFVTNLIAISIILFFAFLRSHA